MKTIETLIGLAPMTLKDILCSDYARLSYTAVLVAIGLYMIQFINLIF